jgi:prefoldin subunit 5
MDIKELKAQAYDLLANIEYLQKQLAEVNQKIGEAMQQANADESKA